MKIFLVFTTIVVSALARPQNGYAYSHPANRVLYNTVGLTSGNSGSLLIGGGGSGFGYANGAANLLVQPTPTANLIVTPTPATNLLVTSTPAYGPSAISIGGAGQYLINGGGGGGLVTTSQVQQPIIQKHIYVHVPPPEIEEQPQARVIAPAAAPVQHYKIIFIKVPSQKPSRAKILAAQQAVPQEKTLIYVLSKKPEEAEDLVLPPPAPVQPSKPEVFFIKYKSQGQSAQGAEQDVRDNILNAIGANGAEAISSGAINTGAFDTGAISAGAFDTGAISAGAFDTGAISTGAFDAGALSAGAFGTNLNGGIVSTTVSPIGLGGIIGTDTYSSTISPINTYSSTISPINTYSTTVSPITIAHGINTAPILTTSYGPPGRNGFIKKKK